MGFKPGSPLSIFPRAVWTVPVFCVCRLGGPNSAAGGVELAATSLAFESAAETVEDSTVGWKVLTLPLDGKFEGWTLKVSDSLDEAQVHSPRETSGPISYRLFRFIVALHKRS